MKAVSSRALFICNSSRHLFTRAPLFNYQLETLIGVCHLSTTSAESSSSYHSFSSSSSSRSSEDVRNVRVSVWWDFENCSLPCNANVFKVAHSITSAIRSNGIKGPIQITAFGDVLQLSRSNQEALSSTGICLTHIPNGGKNSADRSLLMDLMYWVSQNPPPAHLFLISGDRDFANILHRLRMNNYNILLASTENAPVVLRSAASIMWQWSSLVKGENLSGKHFNQPPDGPFASWYGHYEVPLEDPFALSNKNSSLKSYDINSDDSTRPVPKAVLNVIRNILSSSPKGLSITELRSKLGRSDISIEKDFYGHKRFTRFLMALPHVLRVEYAKDGQHVVHGIVQANRETCVPSPDMSTDPPNTSAKDMGDGSNKNTEDLVDIISGHAAKSRATCVPISNEVPGVNSDTLSSKANGCHNYTIGTREDISNVQKPSTDSQESCKKQEELQRVHEQSELSLSRLDTMAVEKRIPEVGIFKKIWRKWFNGNYISQEMVNERSSKNADEKGVQSSGDSADSISKNEVISDAGSVDKSTKPRGFFDQIARFCKFWRRDEKSDNVNAEFSKSDVDIPNRLEIRELFTEQFWKETMVLLKTPEASATIQQSKTRQELAQNLQKLGPSTLQSLSKSHILQLVDLLVSDKKWIEERPSQIYPFRVIQPPGGTSEFKDSESKLQGQDCRLAGSTKKKVSPKTRSQILRDCQKLANEVVKEHPNGFNINSFKRLFLDRYGYPLEVKNLGYEKLATLLQIIPGVKLESNYIFSEYRKSKFSEHEKKKLESNYIIPENSRSDLSEIEENRHDSPWEELGPVKKNADMGLTKKVKEDIIRHDFETLPDNDEDPSDSEEDRLENEAKRGTEEDSSLLQILDSWYSNREDNNTDTKLSPLNNEIKSSSLCEPKRKPSLSYSFVVDKPRNKKEKLC